MLQLASKLGTAASASPREASAGFTLIEVILAIGIATAILLVALVLYHQATQLRGQILQESDRLSSVRLTLDRVATDLRTAQAVAAPGNEFIGDASSMRFARLALASPLTGLSVSTNLEQADWTRIYLATALETNGTQVVVSALNRREEPVRPRSLATEGLLASAVVQTNRAFETLSDFVRYVRFRYWNGSDWAAGWSNTLPPAGVEIVLSTEPPLDDALPDALPPEPFRRVVYIPAGAASARASTNALETPAFP